MNPTLAKSDFHRDTNRNISLSNLWPNNHGQKLEGLALTTGKIKISRTTSFVEISAKFPEQTEIIKNKIENF